MEVFLFVPDAFTLPLGPLGESSLSEEGLPERLG